MELELNVLLLADDADAVADLQKKLAAKDAPVAIFEKYSAI